jgi:hypothetical protein
LNYCVTFFPAERLVKQRQNQTGCAMINKKLFKLLPIICFAFVFFAESMSAGICFCGKCFPLRQSQTDSQIKSTDYKSASSEEFNRCNFEKEKNFRGVNFSKRTPKGIYHSIFINFYPGDRFQVHQYQNGLSSLSEISIWYASNIYLKNLSIRC